MFTLKVQHGIRRMLLCLALVAPVVAQCSSTPQQPTTPQGATCALPQNIQMVLRGGERLNPNDQGQALPVEVRVYQLKSSAKMEESEFDVIWRTDRETLGPDMVKVDMLYLYPGQRVRRAFRREEGVTHVVAVAIFRHPSGQSWRTIYELPPAPADAECAARRGEDAGPGGDPRYYFYLDEYYIEAQPSDPGEDLSDGGRLPGRLPGLPSAPQAPSVPTLPQTPQVPQVPQVPQAPSLPSAPQAPSAPSLPRLKGGTEGHA